METTQKVNNEIYNTLGDRWYEAEDDPVALLRAEGRLRNPWVQAKITEVLGNTPQDILDVGCGGGFLSNHLARHGHNVTGIDLSESSLEVARRNGKARYIIGDATNIPFAKSEFDVVCIMDILEHVEDPAAVIAEGARVLRPGGMLFAYTFNRNFLSWLFAKKGLEVIVRNTPKNLHVYHLFIKPIELRKMCEANGLLVQSMTGIKPKIFSLAFAKLLATGTVSPDFQFEHTKSLLLGYMCVAKRQS